MGESEITPKKGSGIAGALAELVVLAANDPFTVVMSPVSVPGIAPGSPTK